MLPEAAIETLRKVLSGTVLVEPDQTFEIEASLSTRWQPNSG